MNSIKFTPSEYSSVNILKYVSSPIPGSKVLPQWFRNIPRFQNNEKEMSANQNGYHNLTVKHCMPFLDAMNNGYFLTTWTDIYVERSNGEVLISYKNQDLVNLVGTPIRYQKNFPSHIPTKKGYDPFSYVWSTYWRIKTPKGVSCLFTHPLNRPDLPFITLSGIIETDKWNGSDLLNFALSENFEGVIPTGTPYAQIIPFYRNDWEHELVLESDNDMIKTREDVIEKRTNRQSGYYRDNIWEKKSFK